MMRTVLDKTSQRRLQRHPKSTIPPPQGPLGALPSPISRWTAVPCRPSLRLHARSTSYDATPPAGQHPLSAGRQNGGLINMPDEMKKDHSTSCASEI